MDTAYAETDRLAEAIATGSENRVTQLAVLAVLAAYEDATGVHSWRNPDDATGRYFTFLAAAGAHRGGRVDTPQPADGDLNGENTPAAADRQSATEAC